MKEFNVWVYENLTNLVHLDGDSAASLHGALATDGAGASIANKVSASHVGDGRVARWETDAG